MKQTFTYLRLHLPYIIGIALVIVNALVDGGYVHLGDQTVNLVNALLGAVGLGVLHKRQQ